MLSNQEFETSDLINILGGMEVTCSAVAITCFFFLLNLSTKRIKLFYLCYKCILSIIIESNLIVMVFSFF